jgi:hypothetical protein
MMEGQLLKHCRCVKQWVKMAAIHPDLSDKVRVQFSVWFSSVFFPPRPPFLCGWDIAGR